MAFATPLKSGQKVKPGTPMIQHGDSQNLVRFLTLLGFESRSFLNKNLFVVANKDAFQQIMHFLLDQLDRGRCQTVFKDVWPILDKKAEAEFRRLCFEWYKQLQSQHPGRLPSITASLFHSPGGRKFLHFINSFVRFVLTEKIEAETESSLILEPGAVSGTVLNQLRAENMLAVRQNIQMTRDPYLQGKMLGDKLCNDYRTSRTELLKVKAKGDEIVGKVREDVEGTEMCQSFDDVRTLLNEAYEREKNAAIDIIDLIESFNRETLQHFQTFCEVLQLTDIPGIYVKPKPILDLSKFSTSVSKSSTFSSEAKRETVTQILEKLFASVDDPERGNPVEFPLTQISDTVEFVTKEMDKFLKMEYESNKKLPVLEREIEDLIKVTVKTHLGDDEEVNLIPCSPLQPISFDSNDTNPFNDFPFLLSNFDCTEDKRSRRNQLLGILASHTSCSEIEETSDCQSQMHLEVTKTPRRFITSPEATTAVKDQEVSGFSPCLGAHEVSSRTPLVEVNRMAFATPALFKDKTILGVQPEELFGSPVLIPDSGEKENGEETPTAPITKFCLSPSFYEEEGHHVSTVEIDKLSKNLSEILVDDDIMFFDSSKLKTKKRIGMSEKFRRCSLQGEKIMEEDLILVESDDN